MGREFERALEHLLSPEEHISLAMLYHFSAMNEEEQRRFAAVWSRVRVTKRRRAIRMMAELAEDDVYADFTAVFRFALEDEDADVRSVAIDGLWEDESVSLVPRLLHLLQSDPSEAVQARAAAALGRFVLAGELGHWSPMRTHKVVEALIHVISDGSLSTELRRRAVESVAYSSDARVRGIIARAYRDVNRKMRVSAIFAMGRSADPHWYEIVEQEMESDDPEMRYEAARAAGELGDKRAVDQLIALLDDPDPEVREVAIWSLGEIGGQRARRALKALLNHRDPGVVEAAQEALAVSRLNEGIFDPISFVDLSFDLDHVGVVIDTSWDEAVLFPEELYNFHVMQPEGDEDDEDQEWEWQEGYGDAYDEAYEED
ncbi:MAG: HEAT repeat domain-containing protein [Ardenticatenia bacterium]|nr:HEAT repeat domain-containing protein [Ardenticatenia bacterium]